MSEVEHLTTDDLLAYLEDIAKPSVVKRVSEHLATNCEECSRAVAALSRIVSALEADRGFAVPEAARQRAFAIFDPAPTPSLGERILATLISDSRLWPQAAAARAFPVEHSAIELIYEAREVYVGLFCKRSLGLWSISGQVFSEMASETNWEVSAAGPVGDLQTRIDDLNEFHFESLESGTYHLMLTNQPREIVLPDLLLIP